MTLPKSTTSAFLATLIAASALAIGPAPLPGITDAQAARWRPCGKLNYKGKHKLYRRGIRCGAARRKARYVLKHRKSPPGWYCYPTVVPDGFGVCKRNGRAFLLWPS